MWNYHTSRCIKTYTGHTNVKYSSPALVIDPSVGRPTETGTNGEEEGVRASIPEAWIVSGSDTSEVCIWDGQSKELLQRLEGHTGESDQPGFVIGRDAESRVDRSIDTVIALAVHPNKRMIATGGLERDKTIILWRNEDD